MTTSAIGKAVYTQTLDDPETIRKIIAAVASIVSNRIIDDGKVNVPGLGCFSVIHSGGKPHGVGFMACKALNDAVKGVAE